MEEVDSILIYTLKEIGCDVGSRIGELSPSQIIKCVSRCFELIRPDLEVPRYDENVSMSGRYKVASQISQAITDLGFKEEIGCQSFLYPTEADTRKLLIFMMEKLPKDLDMDVGDKIETLLSRIAQENEEFEAANNNAFSNTNGTEVCGIRLPAAVDVDSLPKETLRFYASHLADLTFAKERAKFKKSEPPRPIIPQLPPPVEDDDDDFGDPDEPEIIPEPPKPQIPEKPKIAEKPVPKPRPKPPIKEKPNLIDRQAERQALEEAEEKAAAEAAQRIKSMQEESKTKALELKLKEKSISELGRSTAATEAEIERLRAEIEGREKALDRKRKTQVLLDGSEDGLDKVKKAVENQVEKILKLSDQWEQHRQPLIKDIRAKQDKNSPKNSESARQRDEIRSLKVQLREMGAEARVKEEAYTNLLIEFGKMPKDLNRSAYTKRISEIIVNIKKQKKEITKVLNDTKEIQKDINTLSGRLDRTFAVADELIFKDAEKDKNVAQSYRLLVAIHSDFSRIIKVLEDIGNSKRLLRDLEDKLELEKGKNVEGKLDRLKADLGQMKHENQVLQAKLRDPALLRAAAARRASEEAA